MPKWIKVVWISMAAIVYFVGAGICYELVREPTEDTIYNNDQAQSVIISVFWPVVLPIKLGQHIFRKQAFSAAPKSIHPIEAR